jgi:hypothetical protein
MKDLSSPPESLDLIWSEGAIYIIGFQEGLKKIWPMMKPGAFAVFSDMNYLKYDPPGELKAFFQEECPDMLHKNETIELITQSRFRLVGHFELNKDAHWKPYYQPLQERVYDYRAKYSENPDAMEISNNIQHEIDLFKKYSDYYAYVFYVMQKPYE